MAGDYWGYDNVMGVEFEDRDFHEAVEAYIKEKTDDGMGDLFFVDVLNSTSDEVFYVIVKGDYTRAVVEMGSLTPDDFPGLGEDEE